MREIKFRAWKEYEPEIIEGSKNGEMFYSYEEDFKRGVALVYIGDDSAGYAHEYNWMQYTGLKDKNGKEIYEGDIFGGILENYYVYWDEERCSFWLTTKFHKDENEVQDDVQWFEIVKMKDLEIIGNIYENPELVV